MNIYPSPDSEHFGGCMGELDRIRLDAVLVTTITSGASSPAIARGSIIGFIQHGASV